METHFRATERHLPYGNRPVLELT